METVEYPVQRALWGPNSVLQRCLWDREMLLSEAPGGELSICSSQKCKWHCHFGKELGSFLKKLTIHFPCDPAVPLLDNHPRVTKAHVRTKSCTRVFIAAFFRNSPQINRNRPTCPPRWMCKQAIGLRTTRCYSAVKWNGPWTLGSTPKNLKNKRVRGRSLTPKSTQFRTF